jgi:membrane associated rhomboid family serine protease
LRQRYPLLTVTAIGVLAGAWLGSLLHGGALQAILCLAALAIFGGSVEDALGRPRYALLMTLGAAAALAGQLAAGPHTGAPTLACAGIAAAVLGAHIALHPTARVYSVLFAPMFSSVVAVPALAFVALWLALQVALGLGLGLDEPLAGIGGAWFAHLAALGVGLIAARPLAHRGWVRRPTARAAA